MRDDILTRWRALAPPRLGIRLVSHSPILPLDFDPSPSLNCAKFPNEPTNCANSAQLHNSSAPRRTILARRRKTKPELSARTCPNLPRAPSWQNEPTCHFGSLNSPRAEDGNGSSYL